jgi:dihydrofolate reductase
MRKLIVSEFVSLDGVIEAPGGEPGFKHSGWVLDHPHFDDAGQMKYKLDEVLEADALLLGRVTYQGFAAAWPERDGQFADKMNGMPKYVVTSTLESLEWSNSEVLRGELPGAVAQLKEGDGGPLLVSGSGTQAQTLIKHDLVDEYRLMVFPVVLGSGRRLFPDDADDKLMLRLVDSRLFDSGVAVYTYERASSS